MSRLTVAAAPSPAPISTIASPRRAGPPRALAGYTYSPDEPRRTTTTSSFFLRPMSLTHGFGSETMNVDLPVSWMRRVSSLLSTMRRASSSPSMRPPRCGALYS